MRTHREREGGEEARLRGIMSLVLVRCNKHTAKRDMCSVSLIMPSRPCPCLPPPISLQCAIRAFSLASPNIRSYHRARRSCSRKLHSPCLPPLSWNVSGPCTSGPSGAGNKPRLTMRGTGNKSRWTMTVVPSESGKILFCIIASCAAFGQILETKTSWGAKLSAPLLALLVGMVLSSAGVIPSTAPVYDFVVTSIMPMALSFCLLETDVQSIFIGAGSMLTAFWYGALGTIIGTLVSFKIVGPALGTEGWKVASSLCASYIGGTINYAATAQALGLSSASTLAAGMAADNLAMAAYFAVLMSIPDDSHESSDTMDELSLSYGNNTPTVETIAVSLAAAAAACVAGNALANFLPSSLAGSGLAITALIASCFSAAAAQVHKGSQNQQIQVFAGSQNLGASLMLLYFSVVGASAGFREAFLGGWPLLAFIVVLISVHLIVVLSLGALSGLPTRTVLIASNANIGGPGTAAAMATCCGWRDLVKAAVLVGTLGYTIGTAIGCLIGVHILQFVK